MIDEKAVDAFQGFRDKGGRFTKGNPGGPGRPRKPGSWLTEKAFLEKYPFLLISHPKRCPQCQNNEYIYQLRLDSKQLYTVRCRCQKCRNERYYSPYKEKWG